MDLSEVYKGATKLGKIKLTKDGLDIEGKLIKNIDINSVKVKNVAGKIKVSCELICDSFESIP